MNTANTTSANVTLCVACALAGLWTSPTTARHRQARRRAGTARGWRGCSATRRRRCAASRWSGSPRRRPSDRGRRTQQAHREHDGDEARRQVLAAIVNSKRCSREVSASSSTSRRAAAIRPASESSAAAATQPRSTRASTASRRIGLALGRACVGLAERRPARVPNPRGRSRKWASRNTYRPTACRPKGAIAAFWTAQAPLPKCLRRRLRRRQRGWSGPCGPAGSPRRSAAGGSPWPEGCPRRPAHERQRRRAGADPDQQERRARPS